MASVFVMTVKSKQELRQTRLLIQSIREFGGALHDNPVWVFTLEESDVALDAFQDKQVEVFPLVIPESVKDYWFARKVFTCAEAEKKATPDIDVLIWFSFDCLVVQPPMLLVLDSSYAAAFRPVHITNIGLPVHKSLDTFWKRVYGAVGLSESTLTVESFVDRVQLRAYFNSHIFSWRPETVLAQKWFDIFATLVSDRQFQSASCQDIPHQVFLHQAVLSALVESAISIERLRVLPPDYSYPYNLHATIPPDRQVRMLNDLVCIAYEERPMHPTLVEDISITSPLREWLTDHVV